MDKKFPKLSSIHPTWFIFHFLPFFSNLDWLRFCMPLGIQYLLSNIAHRGKDAVTKLGNSCQQQLTINIPFSLKTSISLKPFWFPSAKSAANILEICGGEPEIPPHSMIHFRVSWLKMLCVSGWVAPLRFRQGKGCSNFWVLLGNRNGERRAGLGCPHGSRHIPPSLSTPAHGVKNADDG